MINIRHVHVNDYIVISISNEMDKTQYDYDYVIISTIFIQKETFELP